MLVRRLVVILATLWPLAGAHADALQDAAVAVQRKDYATATRLLEPLAEAGDARAQSQLAALYYRGQGVAEDNAKALRWYDAAARKGHAGAQYELGNMYAFGHAAPPAGLDPMRLAAQWYHEAARQGHRDAQYSLGLLFLAGSGVTQSSAEARKWFTLAARQGHADAKNYLKAARGR